MCICIYIGYIILLQVCWEFEIRVIGSEGSESFNLLFFIIVLHDMLVSTRYGISEKKCNIPLEFHTGSME